MAPEEGCLNWCAVRQQPAFGERQAYSCTVAARTGGLGLMVVWQQVDVAVDKDEQYSSFSDTDDEGGSRAAMQQLLEGMGQIAEAQAWQEAPPATGMPSHPSGSPDVGCSSKDSCLFQPLEVNSGSLDLIVYGLYCFP